MIISRKMTVLAFALGLCMFFAAGITAAQQKSSDPVFASPVYQCKVFDRYLKNSGLMKLTLDGKTLIANNRMFATLKDADGKEFGLTEKTAPEYEWKNNVLTSRKTLTTKDAKAEPYAEVSRKYVFTPDKVTCEIIVKNLKELTVSQPWKVFTEESYIPTASITGMRADGILVNGQPCSTVIPLKFDKKKWGFHKYMKTIKLTGSGRKTITITAGPGCQVLLGHYGFKSIYLDVIPVIKFPELKQKAGQETRISYTIEFGKAE